MLLRIKAQSTSEYAIVVGAIIALAAGVVMVAFKGGMRIKANQSAAYLTNAGTQLDAQLDADLDGVIADDDYLTTSPGQSAVYQQEVRRTVIDPERFRDQKLLYKGGAQRSLQQQETATTAITVENLAPVVEQHVPSDPWD